jgi:hypothetical protein
MCVTLQTPDRKIQTKIFFKPFAVMPTNKSPRAARAMFHASAQTPTVQTTSTVTNRYEFFEKSSKPMKRECFVGKSAVQTIHNRAQELCHVLQQTDNAERNQIQKVFTSNFLFQLFFKVGIPTRECLTIN